MSTVVITHQLPEEERELQIALYSPRLYEFREDVYALLNRLIAENEAFVSPHHIKTEIQRFDNCYNIDV